MTPESEVETAFNAWYDTERIPALTRVPGVLCARRYRTSVGGTKCVALYYLASPGVVDTAEWQQASASTRCPGMFAIGSPTGCASSAEITRA